MRLPISTFASGPLFFSSRVLEAIYTLRRTHIVYSETFYSVHGQFLSFVFEVTFYYSFLIQSLKLGIRSSVVMTQKMMTGGSHPYHTIYLGPADKLEMSGYGPGTVDEMQQL